MAAAAGRRGAEDSRRRQRDDVRVRLSLTLALSPTLAPTPTLSPTHTLSPTLTLTLTLTRFVFGYDYTHFFYTLAPVSSK